MKKLIFRNIFKDITYFFLLSSFSLTLIVWVIQSVNFLDFVTEDGHGLGVYAKYSLLNLPKIFSRLTIFIFFISTFYILYKYEDNNEIYILWIHGVKKIEFINNFIKFSIIFVIFQLFFTYIIVPSTQEKARSLFKNSDIDYSTSILKSKFFNDVIKNVTIFVGEKDLNGNFKKIFLKEDDNSDTKEQSQIILSKSGKIIKKNEKSNILWGTTRSIINSAMIGVSEGFEKIIELNGVGFRALLKGNILELQLGFSHITKYTIPEKIKLVVEKSTIIKIFGIDKELVGKVASEIKMLKPVEPYKGKGIKERGQYVLRKEGKKK